MGEFFLDMRHSYFVSSQLCKPEKVQKLVGLKVEGEVDPQDVVVDPGFLGIFKGAEEVREGELGSFMVGDFKSCLEAVLIEPSCLLPKEFVSEKGGNVFPREADGRNVFCPVTVDPSVISAERFA